jgi:hypothetical protein
VGGLRYDRLNPKGVLPFVKGNGKANPSQAAIVNPTKGAKLIVVKADYAVSTAPV